VPEGHTVHRLAARHRALFAGRRVTVSSPQGRFAAGAAEISGRVLRETEAAGKHLLHRYSGGRTLHVHLGLYGRFTDGTGDPPPPVGEVRLRMGRRGHWLELRGPAACEVLTAQVIRHLLNVRQAGDLEEWVADSLPSFSLDNRAVRDLYVTLSGDQIQERSLWPRYTGHVRHRNRVAHRSEAATREQAEDSCAAAAELIEHLEPILNRAK